MAITFDNLSFDNLPLNKASLMELAPKVGQGLGALVALFVTYAS